MGSKGNSKESSEDYFWSDSFTEGVDVGEQPVVRKIDDNTLVYASEYFPSFLARVIISENVVIYVQYNGVVTIKTMNCLYLNEFLTDFDESTSLLSSKVDKVLKKHLESNNFELELDYFKPSANRADQDRIGRYAACCFGRRCQDIGP